MFNKLKYKKSTELITDLSTDEIIYRAERFENDWRDTKFAPLLAKQGINNCKIVTSRNNIKIHFIETLSGPHFQCICHLKPLVQQGGSKLTIEVSIKPLDLFFKSLFIFFVIAIDFFLLKNGLYKYMHLQIFFIIINFYIIFDGFLIFYFGKKRFVHAIILLKHIIGTN